MRRNPIGLLAIGFFFVFVGYNPTQQYMISVFGERGKGALAEHVLVLLYSVIAIAGAVLPGIAHRFGTVRRTMMIAAASYMIFVLAVASGQSDTMVMAAVLLGIGGTLLWGTMSRVIVSYGDAAWQARSFAIVSIASSLGIAVGNKAFYMTWAAIGNQAFFVFAGFVGISIAIFTLLPAQTLDAAKIAAVAKKPLGGSWWLAFALLGVQCCNATWGGAINGALMLFGEKQYGEAWINMITLTPIVYCVTVICGGWCADRVGSIRVLLVSCVGFLVGAVLMAARHDTTFGYCVSACMIAAAHGGIYVSVTGSIKKMLDERRQKLTCYGLSTAASIAIATALLMSRMPVGATFCLLVGAAATSCIIAGILFGVAKEH